VSALDRVRAVLREAGVDAEIREFPDGTRTAPEAAAAVGCEVAQICKSLVFRVGDAPLLIVASGANRVDEARFGAVKADARWVREQTGFAIGGIPPVGHARPSTPSSTRTCCATTSCGPRPGRRARCSRSRRSASSR
jgi:prolyl-tRNA editing enzyme YbaK/EbsC (Cys-tRNA(Pro) deacylase)